MPTTVRPLLWKLREAPVFLMGTFHFGPADGFSFGSYFAETFAGSESLVFEIGPADRTFNPALLQRQSGSLQADIGPDLYAQLRADTRYDAGFEQAHPMMVVMNLAVRLYTDLGLRQEHGIDATLMRQALASGKSCRGLETATDQLTALLSTDHASLIRGFNFMIAQPELAVEMRDLVIRSMITGDDAGMRTARELTARFWSPSVAATMLLNRENRWLPQLQAIASRNVPTIVAVGALHLFGDDGLISRLASAT